MVALSSLVQKRDAVHAAAHSLGRERFNALAALAYALEAKDAYTRGHSARVSVYAQAIARRLRLGPAEMAVVVLGGELHDIGKIGVPEELLHKAGPLSPAEHRQVMMHTVIGERILSPLLSDWPELLGVVRWHHERVDGRGGPDGLRGGHIPLAARIVAIADAYDAMTSARPYRPARSVEEALAQLRAGRDTQFDSACVDAFLLEFGNRPAAGRAEPVARPGGRRPRLVRAAWSGPLPLSGNNGRVMPFDARRVARASRRPFPARSAGAASLVSP